MLLFGMWAFTGFGYSSSHDKDVGMEFIHRLILPALRGLSKPQV